MTHSGLQTLPRGAIAMTRGICVVRTLAEVPFCWIEADRERNLAPKLRRPDLREPAVVQPAIKRKHFCQGRSFPVPVPSLSWQTAVVHTST